MLNALIQLSTFGYGVIINFLAPMVYGLGAYGEFIAQNAVVLLIHRAMTIISEPLIRFTSPRMLLASSLVLNGLVVVLFTVAHLYIAPLGSPVLLAGLLLSASCILCMLAMRCRRTYIAFLTAMCVVFGGLMLWSSQRDFVLPMLRVMQLSAWGPSVLCVVYLFTQGSSIPHFNELGKTLADVLRQVPRIISITAVMNLLTSALPVFLAPLLPARDLGLFKVMTSIIQSATIVFPVSTQTVLTNFVNHPRGAEFYRLLSSIAMLYFAAVTAGLVAVALVVPVLLPYVALAALLPAYYQAILLERHLTATHHIRRLILINWGVVAVVGIGLCFLVDTVTHAALLYAGGFTLYAVALAVADRGYRPYPPLLLVLALCPLCVSLMTHDPIYGIGYAILVAAMAVLRHVPTRADVMLLWREL